ncbi:MAG: precorrin-6A synthase (deacetylating) [Hyphomicrobium sp.]|nr:precorrin-6A synthase (deacetylating) [Hyphomicrobium sp.]
MITLSLVGIGSGKPEHMTLAAVRALNAADLILIPLKGDEKSDLANLRREICARLLTNTATRIVDFDLPVRDGLREDYAAAVDEWHDDVACAWSQQIAVHLGAEGRAVFLIWGDPSLFDSSLRIARRLVPKPAIEVIPGITALQALCAAHAIPLNDIGQPFLVTTGRKLRDNGWPQDAETVAVMLDGGTAFETLAPENLQIWWGAYLGMDYEVLVSGPLAEAGPRIVATRREARARHGWIMDTYILKRQTP